MSYKKRKYSSRPRWPGSNEQYDPISGLEHASSGMSSVPVSLLIHEADIQRGQNAAGATMSLALPTDPRGGGFGSALVRWTGITVEAQPSLYDDEYITLRSKPEKPVENAMVVNDSDAIWVDRYDARLLLEALPPLQAHPSAYESDTNSTGGWSDLPSDVEDTFFFTPDEVEDIRREKRRKLLDRNYEERLKARRKEDGDEEPSAEEVWGGSDEEPEETQQELMERTAEHLSSSPNPAQLEMRILANHGADPRFAFLRGRWARRWEIMKRRSAIRRQEAAQKSPRNVLGGLAGYGESDDDSSDGQADQGSKSETKFEDTEKAVKEARGGSSELETESEDPENAIKQARRTRAREWAKSRRAAKQVGLVSSST